MQLGINPASATIAYKGNPYCTTEKPRDNAKSMALGGGAGAVAMGTINKSSKIGNRLVKAIKTSKAIKADRQAKLIALLTKTRFAKLAKNPIVVKGAGALAGLSAVTALVGSAAKIADTYGFLSSQNPEA